MSATEILDGLEHNPQARQVIGGGASGPVADQARTREIRINPARSRLTSCAVFHPFLQTAGRGKWRAVILDSLDVVNRNGANALLKILEEPPERTVLFCLSGKPGNVLATIRSRCHWPGCSPLELADTQAVLAEYWPEADADSVR